MTLLCLAAGAVSAALAMPTFTLAWTHSIEKIRWEEDWRISDKGLEIVTARVRGFGAGMEPPAGATFAGGAWHYRPAVAPLASLTLAHSPYTAGYELCTNGACQPLASFLPGIGEIGTIVLAPCPSP